MHVKYDELAVSRSHGNRLLSASQLLHWMTRPLSSLSITLDASKPLILTHEVGQLVRESKGFCLPFLRQFHTEKVRIYAGI